MSTNNNEKFQSGGLSGTSDRAIQDIPINEMVEGPRVLLINDEGNILGTYPIDQALAKAKEAELDLVKVGSSPEGAVCKLLNFKKYIYFLRKKASHARKNQKQGGIKEVKLRPNIGTGDYQRKLRHVQEFLEQKHKVKVTLRFKGRENAHQEIGMEVMQRMISDLGTFVKVDNAPKLEGSQIAMTLSPATVRPVTG